MKRQSRRGLQIAFLALTLAVIWGHSCIPVAGSAAESGRLTGLLQELLGPESSDYITDHLIRKLAHFTEYAALGFQLLLLLPRPPGFKKGILALNLAFITAFLDESIQMLSDRGDLISDVWLDCGGACFGILLAWLVLRLRRNSCLKNRKTM